MKLIALVLTAVFNSHILIAVNTVVFLNAAVTSECLLSVWALIGWLVGYFCPFSFPDTLFHFLHWTGCPLLLANTLESG